MASDEHRPEEHRPEDRRLDLSEPIRIDAGGWGLSWVADDRGALHQLGLGPDGCAAPLEVGAEWYPLAFPSLDGTDPFRPPALQITHADGTLSTRLVLRSVRRLHESGGEHVVAVTSDEIFDLSHYTRYADEIVGRLG